MIGFFGGIIGLLAGVTGALCLAGVIALTILNPWLIFVWLFIALEIRWVRNGFRKDQQESVTLDFDLWSEDDDLPSPDRYLPSALD